MKNAQSEITFIPSQRGFRSWLGCLILLLGLPALVYYGYCWGLWGRSSLLFQYLFQCRCPPTSEEARYPDEVDVIVSACRYGDSTLSPSGRLLAVHEKEPANGSPYILDLRTGEKVPPALPEKSGIAFLTDNLLYLSLSYEENYIFDRTTGIQYPIREFRKLRPGTYIAGDANLTLLADALREAKYVFFMDQNDSIVALDAGFPTSAEQNFVIDSFGIPGENPDRTEQFLKESNIVYQTIPLAFPEEVVSPDRKFVARPDGIYLLGTGQKIVEGYSASRFYRVYGGKYFNLRGWTYDSRAVIYSELSEPCVIETGFFIFADPYCFVRVPQPAIKLQVPDEYLLP